MTSPALLNDVVIFRVKSTPTLLKYCRRPFCPKLEIQHNKKRKKSVLTLAGEE
jgi:hypothetical protein